jgi:hypothetical protein
MLLCHLSSITKDKQFSRCGAWYQTTSSRPIRMRQLSTMSWYESRTSRICSDGILFHIFSPTWRPHLTGYFSSLLVDFSLAVHKMIIRVPSREPERKTYYHFKPQELMLSTHDHWFQFLQESDGCVTNSFSYGAAPLCNITQLSGKLLFICNMQMHKVHLATSLDE